MSTTETAWTVLNYPEIRRVVNEQACHWVVQLGSQVLEVDCACFDIKSQSMKLQVTAAIVDHCRILVWANMLGDQDNVATSMTPGHSHRCRCGLMTIERGHAHDFHF